MIIVIAFLSILLLVVSTLLWSASRERNELRHQLSDEKAIKAKLLADPKPEQAETETGTLIKRRNYRAVTAETYRNVFDLDLNGMRVLEHLTSLFCKSTYVRGGQEAERESCFRAGQTNVVEHIIKQINRANDPNYKDEVND